MNPIDLTPENIASYAQGIMGSLPYREVRVLRAEEVHDQTYVNWIFRLDLLADGKEQTVYVRQSRGFVKKKPDLVMDPARIAFEVKMLQLLSTLIPGVTPDVLYFDQANNVAVLSDIRRGALLVHELAAGRAHPETGTFFGKIVATVHGKTWGISHDAVRGSKEENDAAIAFHRGMRTEVAEQRYPEIVVPFLKESDQHNRCLVLGDLASKNIFVADEEIRFLDLERAFIGDPAFDLAFLFCHYLIEVPEKLLVGSLAFIERFLVSYKNALGIYLPAAEIRGIEKRLITYTGITVLYRLNGLYLAVHAKGNKALWETRAERLLTGSEQSLVAALSRLSNS